VLTARFIAAPVAPGPAAGSRDVPVTRSMDRRRPPGHVLTVSRPTTVPDGAECERGMTSRFYSPFALSVINSRSNSASLSVMIILRSPLHRGRSFRGNGGYARRARYPDQPDVGANQGETMKKISVRKVGTVRLTSKATPLYGNPNCVIIVNV
jgi:hypothetical protein